MLAAVELNLYMVVLLFIYSVHCSHPLPNKHHTVPDPYYITQLKSFMQHLQDTRTRALSNYCYYDYI